VAVSDCSDDYEFVPKRGREHHLGVGTWCSPKFEQRQLGHSYLSTTVRAPANS
jgi:hypothetical protein